ncbi:MAG: hypothetical protein O3A86_06845 [Bacteroidetes bacterium]|nr:hypothetical protein [Bacteroidota bacterium]
MEQYSNRKWIFIGTFFAILLLYAMRIAGLQLGSTPYKERAINNALNKVTLYPGRSVLFDRNGRILVRNTPSYDLKVFPKKMGKADSVLICQILGLDSADYAERTLLAWINSKKRQRNNSYNRSAVFSSNLSPEQYSRKSLPLEGLLRRTQNRSTVQFQRECSCFRIPGRSLRRAPQ